MPKLRQVFVLVGGGLAACGGAATPPVKAPDRVLASLSLDARPGSPPPTGRQLRLIVDEAACAKLGPRHVDVVETSGRVLVTASFDRLPGRVACAGQPPLQTAVVNLARPVGARRLLDGSTAPPTPITAHAIGIAG